MTQEKEPEMLSGWRKRISSSLAMLYQLQGSTETEFLRVGAALQDIHQMAIALARTAEQLVEAASGERITPLLRQLHHITGEMRRYLDESGRLDASSNDILLSVASNLQQVASPLKDFKRMGKNLFMLEVSIKIESAHMGKQGDEFVNLAMDIKKLSQLIKEKAAVIQEQHLQVAGLFNRNIQRINAAKLSQGDEVSKSLLGMERSLTELEDANREFSGLGVDIARVATENSGYISKVVQSMQFHDIFRQQVEHVIEALEGVAADQAFPGTNGDARQEERFQQTVHRFGDICELQEAQMRVAGEEFHNAVSSIIANLTDIGQRQHRLADEILSRTGGSRSSGSSFLDQVNRHVTASVDKLAGCADQNHEMAAAMNEVTDMVRKMTGLAADIEEIGNEIIIISLNARIKATGVGSGSSALSTLAEEISQLSGEAVERTAQITGPLTQIHNATGTLTSEVHHLESTLTAQLDALRSETAEVFAGLKQIDRRLLELMAAIRQQTNQLVKAIERICRETRVHEKTAKGVDQVLEHLTRVVEEARNLYPASADFRENLRRLAEKYTMESERRIHQMVAGRHAGTRAVQKEPVTSDSAQSDSEFGDNVELF